MTPRLYTFIHTYTNEIVGFFTGGASGTLAYIQWQDNLIAIGLAFLTGFVGALGASTYKWLQKKLKNK